MALSSIEEEQKQKFFYAAEEAAAGMYDDTIGLVVPEYHLMHRTMVDLLKYHFGIFEGRRSDEVEGPILELGGQAGIRVDDVEGCVLDVGAGTGAESMLIMQEFPRIRILALDLCEPMKKEYEKNFTHRFPDRRMEEHCRWKQGDILMDTGGSENLLAMLQSEFGTTAFKAVITAFTIHHFSPDEKRLAYQRMFDVLEPGGILINGDLFSYQSQSLSSYASHFDLTFIRDCFDRAKDSRVRDLKEKWLEHYLFYNRLGPVESMYDAISDASESETQGQATMLREIGFSEVGCPFRYWQVGVLWAKKPQSAIQTP